VVIKGVNKGEFASSTDCYHLRSNSIYKTIILDQLLQYENLEGLSNNIKKQLDILEEDVIRDLMMNSEVKQPPS